MDGVFEALGKHLPPPVSPEEKAPPVAKGKKAKDTKKGDFARVPALKQTPMAETAVSSLEDRFSSWVDKRALLTARKSGFRFHRMSMVFLWRVILLALRYPADTLGSSKIVTRYSRLWRCVRSLVLATQVKSVTSIARIRANVGVVSIRALLHSAEGAAKAEPSPEAQAALEALPPKERLLADVQAAFEAADMPMSEYTALDVGGLARVLSPSIIARAARLVLEEKRLQWTCRRVVVVVAVVVAVVRCVISMFRSGYVSRAHKTCCCTCWGYRRCDGSKVAR